MKKKTPYLDFYYKYNGRGILPQTGLCNCLSDNLLNLFTPTSKQFNLDGARKNKLAKGFLWAHNGDFQVNKVTDFRLLAYEFTELRQTIVLFLSVMNEEY
jgi:hypothetical protein